MKFLRLGQFLPALAQPLLVGRSSLWIKDFPGVAEPFGMIDWYTGVLNSRPSSGFFAQFYTHSDQMHDMNLLVGLMQQVSNIMQAASIFETTRRARKAHHPVPAFILE